MVFIREGLQTELWGAMRRLEMIVIRPNNAIRYQPIIEGKRAIEPPIWHIILADYLKAKKVIDLEVMKQYASDPDDEFYVFTTGNNPTAYHNKLPMNPISYKPKWGYLDLNLYRAHDWHAGSEPRSPYGVVYTSISCPFHCKFCFSKDFYPVGYTERPIDDIVSDFKYLGEHGVRHIKIMDELFAFNEKRVLKLCHEIEKLPYSFNMWAYARIDTITPAMLTAMKMAGINWVAYGIESGNEKIRKSITKGKFTNDDVIRTIEITKSIGIKVVGNFIFGFEDDTLETMQETYDLSEKLSCEHVNFYCLVDKNVDQLSIDFMPKPTKYVSAKEVLRFRDEAYCKYFKTEERLVRTV